MAELTIREQLQSGAIKRPTQRPQVPLGSNTVSARNLLALSVANNEFEQVIRPKTEKFPLARLGMDISAFSDVPVALSIGSEGDTLQGIHMAKGDIRRTLGAFPPSVRRHMRSRSDLLDRDAVLTFGNRNPEQTQNTLIHEIMHKGIEILQNAGRLPKQGSFFTHRLQKSTQALESIDEEDYIRLQQIEAGISVEQGYAYFFDIRERPLFKGGKLVKARLIKSEVDEIIAGNAYKKFGNNISKHIELLQQQRFSAADLLQSSKPIGMQIP